MKQKRTRYYWVALGYMHDRYKPDPSLVRTINHPNYHPVHNQNISSWSMHLDDHLPGIKDRPSPTTTHPQQRPRTTSPISKEAYSDDKWPINICLFGVSQVPKCRASVLVVRLLAM